jgi:hypothetical protein
LSPLRNVFFFTNNYAVCVGSDGVGIAGVIGSGIGAGDGGTTGSTGAVGSDGVGIDGIGVVPVVLSSIYITPLLL